MWFGGSTEKKTTTSIKTGEKIKKKYKKGQYTTKTHKKCYDFRLCSHYYYNLGEEERMRNVVKAMSTYHDGY